MQLIHHSRAPSAPVDADAIAVAGDHDSRRPAPRCGEAILQHQSQQQLRILPIGLLLAHALGANLGGIPDPQLKPQLLQQTLEPARVPAGLHAHSRGYISLLQLPVECFGLLPMR
jgi:hypothetical protein